MVRIKEKEQSTICIRLDPSGLGFVGDNIRGLLLRFEGSQLYKKAEVPIKVTKKKKSI
jgi:hypothetical protein